jgi:hypothetical protein
MAELGRSREILAVDERIASWTSCAVALPFDEHQRYLVQVKQTVYIFSATDSIAPRAVLNHSGTKVYRGATHPLVVCADHEHPRDRCVVYVPTREDEAARIDGDQNSGSSSASRLVAFLVDIRVPEQESAIKVPEWTLDFSCGDKKLCAAVSPCGTMIAAAAGGSPKIEIVDRETKRRRCIWMEENAGAETIGWSPDGRLLICGATRPFRREIRVYDAIGDAAAGAEVDSAAVRTEPIAVVPSSDAWLPSFAVDSTGTLISTRDSHVVKIFRLPLPGACMYQLCNRRRERGSDEATPWLPEDGDSEIQCVAWVQQFIDDEDDAGVPRKLFWLASGTGENPNLRLFNLTHAPHARFVAGHNGEAVLGVVTLKDAVTKQRHAILTGFSHGVDILALTPLVTAMLA